MDRSATQPQGVCAVNPVVATVKQIGRSPLYLMVCLAVTLAFACHGAAVVWESISASPSFVLHFNQNPGFTIPFATQETSLFSADWFLWVKGLGVAAFWWLYAACRSDRRPTVTTGGLIILRVLSLLHTIIMGLALFAVLLGGSCLVAFSLTAQQHLWQNLLKFLAAFDEVKFLLDLHPSALCVAVILLVLFLLAGLAFHFVGSLSRFRTLGLVGEHARGELTHRQISLLAAVYCMVELLLPVAPVTTPTLSFTGIVSLLGQIAAIAAGILMGVVLLRLRRRMQWLQDLSHPQNPPEAESAPLTVDPAPQPSAQDAEQDTPTPVEAPPALDVAPTPAFCTRCGHQLSLHQRYCSNCGRPIV